MVNKRPLLAFLLIALLVSACGGPGAGPPDGPPLTEEQRQGRRIFVQNCASCHATSPDTRLVGPTLYDIGELAETRVPGEDAKLYLENAILYPEDYIVDSYENLMPSTFGRTLTGEELDALVAYLLTLK